MQLWEQCLERLQDSVGTQQFNMWIRPLRAEESSTPKGKALTLLAPNRFVLDWVRDNYLHTIAGLLTEFRGDNAPHFV